MRKLLVASVLAGSTMLASSAYALCSNPAGAAGGAAVGAAAGAAVGGPAGAAVGGVVGGAIGAKALPPTACSYVVEQEVDAVKIEGEVVVGEPLPETVVFHEIPDTKTYVFADVNGHRVIAEADTRVVVEVVN